MRVLFFNEGNLGTHILGQGQLDAALRSGLHEAPELEAHFASLSALGRVGNAAASRPIPLLARFGLDLRGARWHIVQSLRARSQLRRAAQAWPPDVLHVHSQSVALLMGPRLAGAPVVLSVDASVRDWAGMPAWGGAAGGSPWAIEPSLALERRAFGRAPLVLAWTDWARRGVEREAPRANVQTHHPGLDLERYRPAERHARVRPRVLFVGGRFAQKGGEDLLTALGERLGDELELDLVTPEPVAPRPGVRVHRLAPGDDRLLELQQQADVMCLPTYGDSNPWALLEAMACGTPVISSPVGAIPELLAGGRAGVLVPYGEPRALGEAVRALLGDPAQRAQLAGEARARCVERYDARHQLALLAERLRALLGGDAPAQDDRT